MGNLRNILKRIEPLLPDWFVPVELWYNSVQLLLNSLQLSTTLPRTDTTSVRGSFFFEDFSEKIDRNRAKSNLMDFDKSIIGPEVEGSTQQTLTTQKNRR